jgi:hypothetical protein
MPEEVAIIIVIGMLIGLAWGVLNTIKTIVIKKYEARGAGDAADVRRAVAELGRRVEALEDGMMERLHDVEERMDFTERVLAKERRPGELPGRS